MLKISILYSWFVRILTVLLPNIPVFMRFRGWLYSLMFKKCGKNFQITSSAILNSLTGISCGDNVYIAHNCVLIGSNIEIGDNVLIGPNTIISSANHSFKNNSFRYGKSIPGDVVIKHGSWIAGNCSILADSILPAKSILGAGSVLNKKFEQEYALYAGTPAKFVKGL